MTKAKGEAHEHVCTVGLHRYTCTNPDDADLEMGLCPKHKKQTKKTPAKKRAGKRAKK